MYYMFVFYVTIIFVGVMYVIMVFRWCVCVTDYHFVCFYATRPPNYCRRLAATFRVENVNRPSRLLLKRNMSEITIG